MGANTIFILLMVPVLATLGRDSAPSQSSVEIKVLVLNGKNGKPMKHERLLTFFQSGKTHTIEGENDGGAPHTDVKGYAVLTLPASRLPYIQVWVDYRTLCQTDPNHYATPVTQIISNGAATPNNCGHFTRKDEPGTLVVYARHSTLKEQMAR